MLFRSERKFDDCCNEFWNVATYVSKGLLRGEILFAIDHMNEVLRHELLRMISWYVGTEKGFNFSLGKNYKFLDKHISKELERFLYNPSSTPRSDSTGVKTLDYVQDGEYIYSAFMQLYGIDLTECDMHWHKFLALANNIVGDSTLWGYAKSVRGYEKPSKNDTQDKAYQRAKEAWSFPIELTIEEQEMKDEFDSYFDV